MAVGLWASAARCVLTYVVAPALGGAGVLLGTAGIALQVLGVITSITGAVRLRRLGHRAWPAYSVVATVLAGTTVASIVAAAA